MPLKPFECKGAHSRQTIYKAFHIFHPENYFRASGFCGGGGRLFSFVCFVFVFLKKQLM